MSVLFVFFVILASSLTLFLGAWVFLNNPKNTINKNFLLITLFSFLWIITNFIVDISRNLNTALFFSKVTIVGPVFIGPLFLHFSLIFPREKKKISLKEKVLIFIPAFLSLIVVPTQLNVKRVWFSEGGKVDFEPGIFYKFFIFYIFFYFLLAFINLLKNYNKKEDTERAQIKFVFLGFFIALILSLITNLILPIFSNNDYVNVGVSLAMVGFVIFTAYAIVTKQLFGIKVFLTAALIGVIGLILGIQIFIAPNLIWRTLNIIVFVFFLIFGYSLIKSVIREIKLREELQRAYIELEKLDKAKSEFISIASHQLRTPLTAIKGYISMMLEGSYGKVGGKLRGKLQNVAESTERLIRLINDLLSVSRIESGKLEINKERTPLEGIIKSIFDTLTVEAKRKSIELIWKKPDNPLPDLFIDPNKIRDVILNLIDNAIKYTEKGHIEVSAAQTGAVVHVKIADTGAGMTQEEIGKLFKSFSRGTAGEQNFTGGAGLGLYIAKKFVEMHNGQIWVESEGKGKGSTFYIDLPVDSSIETEKFIKNF